MSRLCFFLNLETFIKKVPYVTYNVRINMNGALDNNRVVIRLVHRCHLQHMVLSFDGKISSIIFSLFIIINF
jgi:hypothetical protein